MKKPAPEQSKSHTFGLSEPYIVKSQNRPEKPVETLSVHGIIFNLFGSQHTAAFQKFLTHYNIQNNRDQINTWFKNNYLPPHVAALLDDHGLAFAEELIAEGTEIYQLRIERWAASRRVCSAYAKRALTAALAGQNAKVSIRPTNPIGRPVGWRQATQKPLQIREALARGASPTADSQNATDGRSAVLEEPIPTSEPIADLLDAWFPPRRKNPSVKV